MKDPIAKAEALAAMKASPGWEIVEKYMKEAIQLCLDSTMDSKKTKTWNDLLFYRAKYDAFSKLLYMVDRWIETGVNAKEKVDSEQANKQ